MVLDEIEPPLATLTELALIRTVPASPVADPAESDPIEPKFSTRMLPAFTTTSPAAPWPKVEDDTCPPAPTCRAPTFRRKVPPSPFGTFSPMFDAMMPLTSAVRAVRRRSPASPSKKELDDSARPLKPGKCT